MCYAIYPLLVIRAMSRRSSLFCMAFYKEDKLNKAKETLYKAANENFKKRIGEGRMKNSICDMLLVLRKCDEAEFDLPNFCVMVTIRCHRLQDLR